MADKEYIEREALEKQIDEAQNKLISNDDRILRMNGKYFKGLAWARRLLLDAPAADVVEVRHEKWVDNHCTGCGMMPLGEEIWTSLDLTPPKFEWFMDFCPCCGADMRERKE